MDLRLDEYQSYVADVIENKVIPKRLIADYSNWRHRFTMARWLFRRGRLAPAIDLFLSIVSVNVETADVEEVCSDLENKVWCLHELGQAIWFHEKNAEKALKYINDGIQLGQKYPWNFTIVVRGELFRARWEMLVVSGQATIAHHEAITQTQITLPEYNKSNSILFHAFNFLAEEAYENQDSQMGISYQRKALRYLYAGKETMKVVNGIWINRRLQPEETYQKLAELAQYSELTPWMDTGKKYVR